jgi:hypothetical protein
MLSYSASAGHCAKLTHATFRTPDGIESHVSGWVIHPELDIALAHLEVSPCGAGASLPIVRPGMSPSTLARATFAGYGLTAENQIGDLEFLVEAVVWMDEREVHVNGFGRSGACVGDSGGPLLVRDRAGQVGVLGVLSVGAASCVEIDHYLRLDSVLDWIGGQLELPAPTASCGAIDHRGRCFDDQAVWCEGSKVESELCTGDAQCGFDSSANGYRCTIAAVCAGDNFGICAGENARSCDASGASVSDCAALGLECTYLSTSGVATCQ